MNRKAKFETSVNIATETDISMMPRNIYQFLSIYFVGSFLSLFIQMCFQGMSLLTNAVF